VPPIVHFAQRPLLSLGAVVAAAMLSAGAGTAVADNSGGISASDEVILKRGDRGKPVEKVQQALGVEPVDGIFGADTETAVKDFQRKKGLTVDGTVGPQTREALGLEPFKIRAAQRRVRMPLALRRIARCESGGDPTAVSSDGRYRGKYQFSLRTWHAMGGKGDPAAAPEWLQDRIALKLYRLRGTTPWGSCSRAPASTRASVTAHSTASSA
jgi:Transglycosylase-like domain/Putative peptidoglycan binding domain